jgi:hypothetical protein|nr:MAG TPA: myeloid antimicrobial peptide 27 PEPTIDE, CATHELICIDIN, ALPHA HELIX [Caudoviricetes sp.]
MAEYAYSFDDETCYGIFDTEKEAINEALEAYELWEYENDYEFIFVGKVRRFEPQVNIGRVLEDIADDAYNEGFEDDDYLNNIKGEHMDELEKVLTKAYNKWENSHQEYHNTKFFMTNPKRYSIEELMEEEN